MTKDKTYVLEYPVIAADRLSAMMHHVRLSVRIECGSESAADMVLSAMDAFVSGNIPQSAEWDAALSDRKELMRFREAVRAYFESGSRRREALEILGSLT